MSTESPSRNMSEDAQGLSEEEQEKVNKQFTTAAMKLGMGAVFHPFQYAKVLIQLGHEPVPLKSGKTFGIIGKRGYHLPNAISYIKFIWRQDGFCGMFNGLGANICGNAIGAVASISTSMYMDRNHPNWMEPGEDENLDKETRALRTMVAKALRETICKAAGSVASRPFQVIMIRKMAQFVGKETKYTSLPASITIVYNEEGVTGLLKGLGVQLICDLGTVWAMHIAFYGLNRVWANYISHKEEDEELDEEEQTETDKQKALAMKFLKFAVPFVVNSVVYPYNLISTIMAVNGSGLAAGDLPYFPVFTNWQSCWDYLDKSKQLKRGSKMFFRNYDGPIEYRGGQTFALK